MKLTRHVFASVASLTAALVFLNAGYAQAGPAEDYAEGTKQYAAGDLIAAMPLLQRAADAGHAAAQAAMGEILDQADSGAEAIEYYRKSAAQGNADGQFGLGTMLASGQAAPKNTAEARKWIVLAAEQGHKLAINELALAYINGGLDIPEDSRQSAQALRWIRAAADGGYLTAMEKLAAAYRSGELGLGIDVSAAEQWAEKVRKARGIRQGRRNNRSRDQ
jgi:TPR repeat protein